MHLLKEKKIQMRAYWLIVYMMFFLNLMAIHIQNVKFTFRNTTITIHYNKYLIDFKQ